MLKLPRITFVPLAVHLFRIKHRHLSQEFFHLMAYSLRLNLNYIFYRIFISQSNYMGCTAGQQRHREKCFFSQNEDFFCVIIAGRCICRINRHRILKELPWIYVWRQSCPLLYHHLLLLAISTSLRRSEHYMFFMEDKHLCFPFVITKHRYTIQCTFTFTFSHTVCNNSKSRRIMEQRMPREVWKD